MHVDYLDPAQCSLLGYCRDFVGYYCCDNGLESFHNCCSCHGHVLVRYISSFNNQIPYVRKSHNIYILLQI